MDRADKKIFIHNLCDRIREEILAKLDKIPESWDGIELRELIADCAEEQTAMRGVKAYRSRFKDYKNAKLINNL